MCHAAEIERIRDLSSEELVVGLNGLLSSGRKLTALVVAHLGEVDERRLHLHAGHSSLFAYCVTRLGMSEDEAYRRIEVARLARAFPILFEALAEGRVSLSVAALLKPYSTGDNHVALLTAVSGKTVRQAREVLAAWFPRPDVPPSIRKLPAPRGARPTSLPAGTVATEPRTGQLPLTSVAAGALPQRTAVPASFADFESVFDAVEPCEGAIPNEPMAGPVATHGPGTTPLPSMPPVPPMPGTDERSLATDAAVTRPTPDPMPSDQAAVVPVKQGRPPGTWRSVEPLSPGRYRVQLTASAELKRKLQLARDLLRHAVPDGDLAELVERAVDLLLEQTLKRRFAAKSRPKAGATRPATSTPCAHRHGAATSPADDAADGTRPDGTHADDSNDSTAAPGGVDFAGEAPSGEPPPTDGAASRASRPAAAPRHIPNDVRRAVLARDGLRCAWVAPDGTRCDSQAWLEHDHITPRGLGGDNDPTNVRHFCKPHNRLSAELAYGQATIDHLIQRRRARQPWHADASRTKIYPAPERVPFTR